MSARRHDPFHNPFREVKPELKLRLERWRQHQRDAELEKQQTPAPPPAAPTAVDDEQSFAQAMAGVKPMGPDNRIRTGQAVSPPPAVADAENEAYAALADLVAGHGDFDISDTVEYVEGLAPGVDRRLLKRLRGGDFARQGHLDLHGFTRDEARAAVERFLTESRVGRKRCVLLIHGRGLNSPDRVPVLKNALVGWLTRGRLAKRVLAFATARPVDGGAGALYVLLRK